MSLAVIVNADDFGLTRGVNESIVACHKAGSVTSTSFMANMDAAEHAAILAGGNPSLGVGLHFNLTSGTPVSRPDDVRSIVGGDSRLLSRHALIMRAVTGKLDRAHLLTELNAQLSRMRDLGIEPTHFDSHQHVHALPMVFDVVSQVAGSLAKPIRIPWRWSGHAGGKPLRRRINESVLGFMVSRCVRSMPAGMATNDGLCSVFDLNRAAADLSNASYAELLAPYQTGLIELMVHPALADAELEGLTEITKVSAVEDVLLRSDFLRRHVTSRGGKMVSYRDAG